MATCNTDVTVAGYVCLDITPGFDERHRDINLTTPGNLVLVGPATFRAGGVVANTGLALHQLGTPTSLMGKVGRDLTGHITLELLRTQGEQLAADMIIAEDEASAYAVVVSPPGSDRCFWAYPGTNDTFTCDDIDYDRLTGRTLFHFGYPTIMRRIWQNGGESLAEMFRRVKGQGLITSLDMSTPDSESESGKADWKAILVRTLPHVDVFLPSLPEILYMLDRSRFDTMRQQLNSLEVTSLADGCLLDDVAEQMLSMGCAIAGLKLGDQGLYIRTASGNRFHAFQHKGLCQDTLWHDRAVLSPCFDVAPVNTNGAGDATIAGFLSALLRGMALEDALNVATATGAWRVEEPGATLRWGHVEERTQSSRDKRPVYLDLEGWRYDRVSRQWVSPRDRTYGQVAPR